MSIRFNNLNNGYNNYNLVIEQETKKAKEAAKQEETKEVEQKSTFRGLENETDLLTQNLQNLYQVKVSKFTAEDKQIADETNEILASLGYANYKVTPSQVASVANGMNTSVIPGMELAEAGVVASHIEDPEGPFADLFAKN